MPESQTVRVGAGVVWSEVAEALVPHGLTARAGSAGDVGVVGYTLGGGHSWLGRKHGLATSAVTAVELVTGDGEFHRVDADTEPELFWGVRGGGGNAGVVIRAGVRRGPDLRGVRRRRCCSRSNRRPRSSRRTSSSPATSTSPRRPACGCCACRRCRRSRSRCGARRSRRSTASSTRPSRSRSGCWRRCAHSDLSSTCSSSCRASAFAQIHMDPPGPVPGRGDGFILEDLPEAAVAALFSVAGPGTDCPLLAVDLRHLGRCARPAGPSRRRRRPPAWPVLAVRRRYRAHPARPGNRSSHGGRAAGRAGAVDRAAAPTSTSRRARRRRASSTRRRHSTACSRCRTKHDPDRTIRSAHELN